LDGFAWVACGYTIENYVPAEILCESVGIVHPHTKFSWVGNQYANPLESIPSPKSRESRWRWFHDGRTNQTTGPY
jgi:hypothetical protein